MTDTEDDIIRGFEEALAVREDDRFVLALFVSGASARSARAITNAKALCEEHLAGRYDLTIVDLHEDLSVARQSRVLAAPTLVRHHPLPVRRFVGDLSDPSRVLVALGLGDADAPNPAAG